VLVIALASTMLGQVPASQHVVVVVEENHDYSQVIGSSAMPYLNSLVTQYGLATQYYADTHPSIGNYFMMTTGQIITNNDNYNQVVSVDNLVRHLLTAGKTWKSYAEDLPSVGYTGGDTGEYVKHHNPFAYISDVVNSQAQKNNLVPFTQFATDLNNNALPNISFVIPNLIDDAHDGTLQQSDAWLQANIAPLLTNSAFRQDGILIIVYDESASDNTHGGGRIAFVVVGPNVILGGRSSNLYQHENLLRTIMEAAGLTSFPGNAATASDMHDLFLQVTLNPASLTFGSQLVGTTSSPQAVTLTNNQTTSVTSINIGASGDFAQTNNCGTSLAANSSCTINVTFTPSATGTRSGTLTVTDSAGTQTTTLTGTGSGNVSITPATFNFGNVGVGNSSSPQAFTLTNGNTTALTGVSISISGANAGDFSQTNNCGTTVAANSSCTISLTFAPTAIGGRSAVLVANDSAGSQSSNVSGTGTDITPPVAQITAPTNGSTVSNTVSVTATATDNVGITSMLLYIDGSQVASSTTSPLNYSWNTGVVGNGTHTIYSEAFDAAGNMGTSPTISVTVNNAIQQLIQNSGFETGNLTSWISGGALVPSVTNAKHNTGSYSAVLGSTTSPQQNGDSWVYQTLTIPSSSTAASLNFYYWAACADSLSNDWQEAQIQNASGTMLASLMKVCSNTQTWTKVYFNLLPYKGQTIRVYFNSHGNGDTVLTYMYLDDVTVSVKAAGGVSLSPTTLGFGSQNVGTTSAAQTLTLTNTTGSTVTGVGVSVTGTNSGDYAQTNNCATSLANGASCTINVTFTPTATGTRTASIMVTDSAGTQSSTLTGTGVAGSVTLTPVSWNFGNQGVGTTSAAQTFTLSNSSGSTITGLAVSLTGSNAADFAQSNNCGTSVANGAGCTINVTFTPAALGSRSATLTVTDSAGTQTSGLSGTGADTTAPTTQITAPANGATLSGTATVTATASDNVGVTSIQIYIDGAQVATGTSSPLNYSWNTTNATNGTHTIYSKASDAAGNVGTSSTITVTVNNGVQQLIQNTGFETGNLQNWTAGGALTPSVTNAKHNTGSYSAVLGSTTAPQQNGDSWIYQTVTIPSSSVGASLNMSYWGVCNDTLTNDWQEVQIQTSAGVLLAQALKTCATSTGWTKLYFNLLPYKGQTIRILMNAHGNGDSNLTYLYVDDITVSVK
jgi:acid phosphatase